MWKKKKFKLVVGRNNWLLLMDSLEALMFNNPDQEDYIKKLWVMFDFKLMGYPRDYKKYIKDEVKKYDIKK